MTRLSDGNLHPRRALERPGIAPPGSAWLTRPCRHSRDTACSIGLESSRSTRRSRTRPRPSGSFGLEPDVPRQLCRRGRQARRRPSVWPHAWCSPQLGRTSTGSSGASRRAQGLLPGNGPCRRAHGHGVRRDNANRSSRMAGRFSSTPRSSEGRHRHWLRRASFQDPPPRSAAQEDSRRRGHTRPRPVGNLRVWTRSSWPKNGPDPSRSVAGSGPSRSGAPGRRGPLTPAPWPSRPACRRRGPGHSRCRRPSGVLLR